MIRCSHRSTILVWLMLLAPLRAAAQTFSDVSDSVQLPLINGLGYQGAWFDYNNDGFPDIIGEDDVSVFLFRNNNAATFANVTASSGLAGVLTSSISVGDYNNDGFADLLLGARVFKNVQGQSFQGTFTAPGSFARTIWIDYDGDGRLDIFGVRGYGTPVVFRNLGNDSFVDVTAQMTLPPSDYALTCAAGDFDNDGFTDMYIGRAGINQLLRNIAARDFENQPTLNGFGDPRTSVSAAWGDYDNDGDLDIYSANISSNRNALFRNNGDYTFTDVTLSAGVGDVGDARTATFLDVNNDGLLDIFATNHVNPNRLFRNNGNGTFTNIAPSAGIASPQDGFGVSWADFDRDGDLDVVIVGHDARRINILRNNGGNSRHWLRVALHGVFDNRMGIGARLDLFARGRHSVREVDAGAGSTGHDEQIVHFGLDTLSVVDSLVIRWPSGLVQRVAAIPANQTLEVVQTGNVPPRPFRLLLPLPDSTVVGDSVRFVWNASSDPDSNRPIVYTLRIQSTGVDTLIGLVQDTVRTVNVRSFISLPAEVRWSVLASDGTGVRRSWDERRFQYRPGSNDVPSPQETPQRFRLLDIFPNPFSPMRSTTAAQITFELPLSSNVRVRIYDVLGREVRELFHHRAPAGRISLRWDGADASGRQVVSGVYFVVMEGPGLESSRPGDRLQKLLLIR